ncbi:MAG: hypothetical protein UR93_C0002G0011 [Berkelbacteria bacterium GW2011_GWA2_35_9]|uniref:Cell division protein FtsX n=1 Tax=Berkelbacteria bacterium GW2011_GWA2_35_9 TaxID=1618333 RepID=A0A0G0D4I3_9BACT|nr:MAG: hypothetical protein UR93_C0002G0011 [Berkelbacteria bacterium GW2011_GWA2_35_9]
MIGLVKLKRIILLGLRNFYRNGWLSTVATLMMSLTLIIITSFVVFNLILSSVINVAKNKIDLSVYFKDSVSEAEIIDYQVKLKARADVETVEYINKEKALSYFKLLPIKNEIKELLKPEDNILPRSLKIKTKDPENIATISDYFSTPAFKLKLDHISTKDNQEVIDRLLNMSRFIRWVGSLVSLLFIIIALVIIINTICLTIFARQKELEVMQLVGASWSFIRLPFLVESVMYVILATIISTLVLFVGFRVIQSLAFQYLSITEYDLEKFLFDHIYVLIGWQLLTGLFISLISTIMSLRKYLKI